MPKYKVSTCITEFYLAKKYDAPNSDEAERMYLEDIELGKVPVISQDYGIVEVEEVN